MLRTILALLCALQMVLLLDAFRLLESHSSLHSQVVVVGSVVCNVCQDKQLVLPGVIAIIECNNPLTGQKYFVNATSKANGAFMLKTQDFRPAQSCAVSLDPSNSQCGGQSKRQTQLLKIEGHKQEKKIVYQLTPFVFKPEYPLEIFCSGHTIHSYEQSLLANTNSLVLGPPDPPRR